jgi:hypothetical protein
MEVHHHTHHPKRWKEYFWEFFMLFLAVFCGFLAEIQLEHYIERQREEKYIENLIVEIKQDLISLDESNREIENNVKRLDTLLQIIRKGEQNARSADLYYLARIGSRLVPLFINDFTITQLKYSGGFRLIHDLKVAKEIALHYSKQATIEKLYNVDLNEADDYRKIALEIFDPLIFDALITANGQITRPNFNPPFIENNAKVFKKFAGTAAYLKNTRKSLIIYQSEFKKSAENLISLIEKSYHLK